MPSNPRGNLPARDSLRSPRALSEHERKIAEWILRNGKSPQRDAMLAQLKEARVIRQCPCGCDSVDFLIPSTGEPKEIALTMLGDYFYDSQDAGLCGIFVFAKGEILGGIEVYSFGDTPARLPKSSQLRPAEFPDDTSR